MRARGKHGAGAAAPGGGELGSPPAPEYYEHGADCLPSGWISDRGLQGELITWGPGELGAGHPGAYFETPDESN